MAPVYIARHLPNPESTSDLFTIKGLSSLAPSPISSLGVFGIPLYKEVAYAGYKDNIDAFIYATASRKKVFCALSAFPNFTPRGLIPIGEPPLEFAFKKNLPADKQRQFMNLLGAATTTRSAGKMVIYTVHGISDAMLEKILPMHNDNLNTGPDFVTPWGLKAFRFLRGITYEFMATHTYPGFSHDPREDNYLEVTQAYTGRQRPTQVFDSAAAQENPNAYSSVVAKKYHNRDLEDEDGEEPIKEEALALEAYEEDRVAGYITMSGVDAVLTAKPSPGVPGNNIGHPTNVPELPGILFPYFHGLNTPDYQLFRTMAGLLFYRLLGSTAEECREQYIRLRRGFNSVATTNHGMVMNHIMLGCQLALQTQSRLFLIATDDYKGFCLLGSGFTIFDGTGWVAPVPADVLRNDMQHLDPHLKAASELSAFLSRLRLEYKYEGKEFTAEELGIPENAANVIRGLKIEKLTDDDTKSLNSCFRSLNFRGSHYREPNPQNIRQFLTAFFSSEPVSLEMPTYIPSISAPVDDRAFVLLSRFGPDAPSFWNNGGTEISCASTEVYAVIQGKRKATDEVDKFGNMPDWLLVTPKPLLIAVKDFATMLERKAVKMDMSERAGKNRNKGIRDEEERKGIWALLVDGMASVKKVDTGKGKGKAPMVPVNYDDLVDNLFG